MPKELEEGLDSRGFMIASIATVGASVVAAGNAGPAEAASADRATSRAPQATVYTGDVVAGKKAISALDVADLEPGKK